MKTIALTFIAACSIGCQGAQFIEETTGVSLPGACHPTAGTFTLSYPEEVSFKGATCGHINDATEEFSLGHFPKGLKLSDDMCSISGSTPGANPDMTFTFNVSFDHSWNEGNGTVEITNVNGCDSIYRAKIERQ